jgi:hypothetical protein
MERPMARWRMAVAVEKHRVSRRSRIVKRLLGLQIL